MQDLDEARQARKEIDRIVRIGGVDFVIRSSVRPEALIEWEMVDIDTDPADMLRIMDELIDALIEDPAQRPEWTRLRMSEEDAISSADIFAFIRAAVAVASGRPTEQPSASTPGGETTQDSSTAGTPVALAVT